MRRGERRDQGGDAAAGAAPLATEEPRRRALTAALDGARFQLTRLVRTVADRLAAQPRSVSLAALELEVRDALVSLGRDLLTELVRLRGTGARGPSYVCPCGVRLVLKEVAPLQQRTWFGTVTLERAVYAGAGCRERAHHVPLDADWALLGAVPEPTALADPDGGTLGAVAPGVGPARLSPAFAAAVVAFGARLPFAEAARLLAVAAGPQTQLAPNTVGTYTKAAGRARQRQEDALRVRLAPPSKAERRAVFDQPRGDRPAAAPDTLVVTMDGAIERTHQGWKEVKLGAVYDLVRQGAAATRAVGAVTYTATRAVGAVTYTATRAVGAVTYTATLAATQTFGRQVLAAAQRRGLGWAHRVVVLGDGAKWIWKLADRRFPQAVQIVDWYHARAHLWALAQLLAGEGTAAAWEWAETLAGVLWTAETAEEVRRLATAADEAWATPRNDLPDGAPRRTQARRRAVDKALAYFAGNAARMRYGAFRALDLPVGSGVVEGGCQSVLHTRLKRPGACWNVESAECLVRARAVVCSAPAPACPHPWDRLAS